MTDQRVIWYAHPYAGGPGVGRYDRPFHLARHWEMSGVSCVVITSSRHHLLDVPQPQGSRIIEGVKYEFLSAPAYQGNGLKRLINMATFSMQLLRNGPALVKRYGYPSMIIASSPHPYVFLSARFLAWRYKARCVFEVRDLWPLSLIELAGVNPGHPFVTMTAWLERYAYKTADAVVSLLPGTKSHMLPLGLKNENWHYIPNGIDALNVDDEKPTSTAMASIDLAKKWRAEGRMVIVYAGALGAPNYVESLVRAISLLHAKGSKASAIIVGRGELEEELRRLVAELGLQDKVVLFGQIPKRAIMHLLKTASAGYISLRPEPIFRFGVSPNKLFDYMLASLPVIFAVSSGNDPVKDSRCGISTDPGNAAAIADAIDTLSRASEQELQQMGERGREYVLAHHSYATLANIYLQLREQLR